MVYSDFTNIPRDFSWYEIAPYPRHPLLLEERLQRWWSAESAGSGQPPSNLIETQRFQDYVSKHETQQRCFLKWGGTPSHHSFQYDNSLILDDIWGYPILGTTPYDLVIGDCHPCKRCNTSLKPPTKLVCVWDRSQRLPWDISSNKYMAGVMSTSWNSLHPFNLLELWFKMYQKQLLQLSAHGVGRFLCFQNFWFRPKNCSIFQLSRWTSSPACGYR